MLRQSRLDAGFDSHGALAKTLNVSRPVISKAENPVHPVPSDALLAAWANETGADVAQFTELAQRAKSGTPDWFVPYRQAESEATVIRSWAPLIVPGLEQTEGYARAVLGAEPYTPEQLDGLLTARLERQQVLQRAYVVSIIDAGVLVRCIGSAAVMAEQCAHLVELAERPNIALHVVPEGTNTGAWGALDVASRDGLATVNFSTATDDVTTTATERVDRALMAYERILGYALPKPASLESSYSGGANGSCVETASTAGVVLVRDTTDRAGFTLNVPAEAWAAFTAGIK
jgi:transcriptional regulator with XRE-family HTH domain